jgi:hypothetical protein
MKNVEVNFAKELIAIREGNIIWQFQIIVKEILFLARVFYIPKRDFILCDNQN